MMTKKDLRSLLARPRAPKWGPTDPIELFNSLKINPKSTVQELWHPQGQALREWHEHRSEADTLFELNTGAGKTLLGAIAAQSIVHETEGGKVLYVCATNQLVEQTASKASEYGFAVSTYMSGQWTGDAYHRGDGVAITNYHAVLNGRSIFRNEDVAAVVFDDAHTAHDVVREQFTLTVDRSRYPKVYESIAALTRPYFESVRRQHGFDAVVQARDTGTVLLVPTFVSTSLHKDVEALLLGTDLDSGPLGFPWQHLRDHLEQCLVLIDAGAVSITPWLPPVHRLRVFGKGVRRLYLSATVGADDEFHRTFGRVPSRRIMPGGRAGDTERLVLTAPENFSDADARDWASEALGERKALIMVPTKARAAEWGTDAEVFRREDGHARIRAFAASHDERLVMVARYDGIDLPGDDCRAMVIDGLPAAMSLVDRFLEQHLELRMTSDSKVASRFVQLLGRISRGMSDYGVVLLIGARLLRWVKEPAHRRLLPAHIQKQLEVGDILAVDAPELDLTAADLVVSCLVQEKDWASFYAGAMQQAATPKQPRQADLAQRRTFAEAERRAAQGTWEGDPGRAVTVLKQVLPQAYEYDVALGAWFEHWLGLACQQAGDGEAATAHYRAAARNAYVLGRLPDQGATPAERGRTSAQAERMATLLGKERGATILKALEQARTRLGDPDASSNEHEEAVRVIGHYLGYESSRPDKDTGGKGPDNLWVTPDETVAWVIDLKTRKVNKHYDKDAIGRLAQHVEWVRKQHTKALQVRLLIGPRVGHTSQATPPENVLVVPRDEFARLAGDVGAVYERAIDSGLDLWHVAEIDAGLRDRSLTWEGLPSSIDSTRLEVL
jgi:hypothetical protein